MEDAAMVGQGRQGIYFLRKDFELSGAAKVAPAITMAVLCFNYICVSTFKKKW